jgi:MFS family permease
MNRRHVSLDALIGRAKNRRPAPEPLPPLTRRMFLLSFMAEFIVIYPFYVIMFSQRGGVSAAGVGMLLAIWLVVSVVAEVPTGVIADKMSKKWSLVLGRIMQLLTFAIWLMAPNFTGYLTGFIVWGIGEAFLSGAFQAYLYESLDASNKKIFGKVYSRSNAFTMLAYTTGSLVAFLIGPHFALLLILSILVSAVSLGITLSLPNTQDRVDVEIRPKILSSALHAIRSNVVLRRLIVGAIILQGLMGMLGEYLPAYYQQAGTPTKLVALVMSVGSGAAALLYWWMHRIETQLTKYQLLYIAAFTGLFVVSFAGGVAVAVIGMFIFTRLLRMMTVHNEAQMQHHAPSEARATLGSLYSFVAKLVSAGLISTVGFFAINNKIVMPLRWSVVVMFAAFALSTLYFSLREQRGRISNF